MSFKVKKSGKSGWRVVKVNWSNNHPNEEKVPREAWRELGFNPEWTIVQAQERRTRLNAEKSADKRKLAKAAKNFVDREILKSIALPEDYAKEFQRWLEDTYPPHKIKHDRIMSHWKTAQKVIVSLNLMPSQFARNADKIYNYFVKECISANYAQRIVTMMNKWGDFVCEKQNQTWRPIPKASTSLSADIQEAYVENKDKYRGPSEILTPTILESLKDKLPNAHYNFLYLTVWLGLRPEEVRRIRHHRFPVKFEFNVEFNCDVVIIYQSKLRRVSEDRRWKFIPAFFPQQVEAVRILRDLEWSIKAPLCKTLKAYTGKRITLYGGRKGFTDLMLSTGQPLEEISSWMGHQKVDTTWKHYRNLKRISVKKPA